MMPNATIAILEKKQDVFRNHVHNLLHLCVSPYDIDTFFLRLACLSQLSPSSSVGNQVMARRRNATSTAASLKALKDRNGRETTFSTAVTNSTHYGNEMLKITLRGEVPEEAQEKATKQAPTASTTKLSDKSQAIPSNINISDSFSSSDLHKLTPTSFAKSAKTTALRFRVFEAVDFLQDGAQSDMTTFEEYPHIYDLTVLLTSAQESVDKYGNKHVCPNKVATLAQKLDAYKTLHLESLRAHLVKFIRWPTVSAVSARDLRQWHECVASILNYMKDFAKEAGFEKLWSEAYTHINDRFRKAIDELRAQADQSAFESATVGPNPEKADAIKIAPFPAALLQTKDAVTKAAAHLIIDSTIDYFKNQLETTSMLSPMLFEDLRQIQKGMTLLLSPGDEEEFVSLKDKLVGQEKDLMYQHWCGRFAQACATPALNELQERFSSLESRTDTEPIGLLEADFFHLAKDLQTLANLPPERVSERDWAAHTPQLSTGSLADQAMDNFEDLYYRYQHKRYAKNELTQLWLLTWRTLRAFYELMIASPEEASMPKDKKNIFAIESEFMSTRFSRFATILESGDALSQRQIELLVDQYCSHVAECHKNKADYYPNFQLLRPKAIAIWLRNALEDFEHTPSWDLQYIPMLHRVALRLNSVLGARGSFQRWSVNASNGELTYWDEGSTKPHGTDRSSQGGNGGPLCANGGNGEAAQVTFTTDLLGLGATAIGTNANNRGDVDLNNGKKRNGKTEKTQSTDTSSFSESSEHTESGHSKESTSLRRGRKTAKELTRFIRHPTQDNPRVPNTSRVLRGADTTSLLQIPIDTQATRVIDEPTVFPGLDGTRHRSAYPHVSYPAPETGAIQNTKSQLIRRDMSTPGHISEGPRPEEVVHTPIRPLRLAEPVSEQASGRASRGFIHTVIGTFRYWTGPASTSKSNFAISRRKISPKIPTTLPPRRRSPKTSLRRPKVLEPHQGGIRKTNSLPHQMIISASPFQPHIVPRPRGPSQLPWQVGPVLQKTGHTGTLPAQGDRKSLTNQQPLHSILSSPPAPSSSPENISVNPNKAVFRVSPGPRQTHLELPGDHGRRPEKGIQRPLAAAGMMTSTTRHEDSSDRDWQDANGIHALLKARSPPATLRAVCELFRQDHGDQAPSGHALDSSRPPSQLHLAQSQLQNAQQVPPLPYTVSNLSRTMDQDDLQSLSTGNATPFSAQESTRSIQSMDENNGLLSVVGPAHGTKRPVSLGSYKGPGSEQDLGIFEDDTAQPMKKRQRTSPLLSSHSDVSRVPDSHPGSLFKFSSPDFVPLPPWNSTLLGRPTLATTPGAPAGLSRDTRLHEADDDIFQPPGRLPFSRNVRAARSLRPGHRARQHTPLEDRKNRDYRIGVRAGLTIAQMYPDDEAPTLDDEGRRQPLLHPPEYHVPQPDDYSEAQTWLRERGWHHASWQARIRKAEMEIDNEDKAASMRAWEHSMAQARASRDAERQRFLDQGPARRTQLIATGESATTPAIVQSARIGLLAQVQPTAARGPTTSTGLITDVGVHTTSGDGAAITTKTITAESPASETELQVAERGQREPATETETETEMELPNVSDRVTRSHSRTRTPRVPVRGTPPSNRSSTRSTSTKRRKKGDKHGPLANYHHPDSPRA